MGIFDGIITSSLKTVFTDAIDALLANDSLTVPCTLIFEDTLTEDCPNCIFDPLTNRSSNIYEPGGPIPFTQGNCPYCYGIGVLVTDNTSSLNLAVLWNYKDWIGWGGGISDNTMMPFGYAQTLSKLSTLSDIKRAKEIILDTDLSAYVKHVFQRISEPNPIGFGGNDYIATMWKRISG